MVSAATRGGAFPGCCIRGLPSPPAACIDRDDEVVAVSCGDQAVAKQRDGLVRKIDVAPAVTDVGVVSLVLALRSMHALSERQGADS
jgi:hypothetical protein